MNLNDRVYLTREIKHILYTKCEDKELFAELYNDIKVMLAKKVNMDMEQNIIKFFKSMKKFESIDDIPEIPILEDKSLYEKVVVKNLIRCGAIPKTELKVGHKYKGVCRNADTAEWNGNTFIYTRYKFGSSYEEEINHFEDDDKHDLFVPLFDITE